MRSVKYGFTVSLGVGLRNGFFARIQCYERVGDVFLCIPVRLFLQEACRFQGTNSKFAKFTKILSIEMLVRAVEEIKFVPNDLLSLCNIKKRLFSSLVSCLFSSRVSFLLSLYSLTSLEVWNVTLKSFSVVSMRNAALVKSQTCLVNILSC